MPFPKATPAGPFVAAGTVAGDAMDDAEDVAPHPVANSMAMITGHARHAARLDDDAERDDDAADRPGSFLASASRAGGGLSRRSDVREKRHMGRTTLATAYSGRIV